jgi:creatinine amidohydrolase
MGRVVRWADLPWTEVRAAVEAQPVVMLPIGAIEEHGPHMAVGADWMVARHLGEQIAEEADLLIMPSLPYGPVWALAKFPGTLAIRDETLISTILDLERGLEQVGVKGIVIYSGHLGNMAALKQASRRMEEAQGLPCLPLLYPGHDEVAAKVRTSPAGNAAIPHAEETETSVLLALSPRHVDMTKAVTEYPDYGGADFHHAPLRWHPVTESGVFGDAKAATKEKGQAIVDHVRGEAVTIIADWRRRYSI